MPEKLNQISPENSLGTVLLLHNDVVHIEPEQFLLDLESSRSRKINGQFVAVIELQSPIIEGSETNKRFAIVDFGKDAEDHGKAIHYYPPTQKELTAFGATRSRFALIGLNYYPEGHFAFLPLQRGKSEIIGSSEENPNNHLFGLVGARHSEDISKLHCTFLVDENGAISIEDHSSEGTKIIIPSINE